MKKNKIKISFILSILTLPILIDTSIGGYDVNFSLADIFFPILLIRSFHIHKRLSDKDNKFINKYLLFCILFLFFIIISTSVNALRWSNLSNSELFVAYFKIIKLLIGMGYGYIYSVHYLESDYSRRSFIKKIFMIAGLLFSITCILGVIVPFFNQLGWAEGYRACGTTDDPNLAATLLLMYLGITIGIVQNKKSFFSIICLFIILFGIIFTASKGMLVSLILGTLIYSLFNLKSIKQMLKIVLIISFTILVGMYAIKKIPVLNNIVSRIVVIFNSDSENINNTTLFTGRNLIWASGINSLKQEANIITGVGYGFYGIASKNYNAVSTRGTAHNTLISLFVELGIIGLIIFLKVFLSLINKAIIMAKNNFSKENIFLVTVMFLQSMSLNLQNNRNFWIMAMLILCDYYYFKYLGEDK